ncbi:hypothetical protein [Mycoplasmoides pirum]|uniref:GHMP family kinase ATP-binding protein n=1 Tax=Mycoplasmoides pirum TaxID=2122 RepID=UPI0006971695|nr:hypothetical protein [Mycoplasmoides pirum]
MQLKLISYCKFNLFLNVLNYSSKFKKHEIFSLFVLSKKFFDTIYISENSGVSVEILYKDKNQKNLKIKNEIINKTIAYFEKYYNVKLSNLKITIIKRIPIGSGLGGGSSNAATILLFLYKKFNIPKNKQIPLLNIAIDIGSDVPFFLTQKKFALVSSYGNVVNPINLNKLSYNIIINKEICNTNAIFAKYKQLKKSNIIHYQNDLMQAAFCVNPKLLKIYKNLSKKYSNVTMSGSGSSFVVINN